MTAKLFNDIARTHAGPAAHGESFYSYLDRSCRPQSAAVRELLNRWFEEYPTSEQHEMRRRMGKSEHGFETGFFEFYLHALMTRIGFEVTPHPKAPDRTTRPDYLLSRSGTPFAYLEAIVPHRPDSDQAREARIDQLYELLDRTHSPNFWLALSHVSGSPDQSPKVRPLRERLESWLTTLNPDQVIASYEATGELPKLEYTFRPSAWTIEVEAIPKSAAARGKEGVRPVGVMMGNAKWVDTRGRIRGAITNKGSKYGDLALPYIIGINLVDQLDHLGPDDWLDLQDAVLGSECVIGRVMTDGSTRMSSGRGNEGAWMGPEGPRLRRVSAVMISSHLHPASIAKVAPTLLHHPSPTHPIPDFGWPFGTATLDSSRLWEEVQYQAPTQPDFFGVGASWPYEVQN